MPRPATGVWTRPGILSVHIGGIGISRKELAAHLGVTVRTLHNVEHGRKRVEPSLLDRLAATLNGLYQSIGCEFDQSLTLTADHFSAAPLAMTRVVLTCIALNQPGTLVDPQVGLASRHFSWLRPGNPRQIPFAGDGGFDDAADVYAGYHRYLPLRKITAPRFLTDPRTRSVTVLAQIASYHYATRKPIDFPGVLEVHVQRHHVCGMTSSYDAALLSEFLERGAMPPSRK